MNNLGFGITRKIGYLVGSDPRVTSLQNAYPPTPTTNNSDGVGTPQTRYKVAVVKINQRYYFSINGKINPTLCLTKGQPYYFDYTINPAIPCLFGISDTTGVQVSYTLRGEPIAGDELLLLSQSEPRGELAAITIRVIATDNPDLSKAFYQCIGGNVTRNWIYFVTAGETCPT